MLPCGKSLFQNAENDLRIRLFRDPAHLQPENVVKQIDRTEMHEPMKIVGGKSLQRERAMLKKLRVKCKKVHSRRWSKKQASLPLAGMATGSCSLSRR